MVVRRCRQILKDDALAQDATQDVFVQLILREEQLEDRGLSSLLFQIATRVSLNQLRNRRRHPEDRDESLLAQIACLDDAEERLGVRSLLSRIFEREAPSTRVMATLHWVDGMTYKEVAQVVGLSVSGVRKRLRQLQKQSLHLSALGSQPDTHAGNSYDN